MFLSTLDTNTGNKTMSTIDLCEKDLENVIFGNSIPSLEQVTQCDAKIVNIPTLINQNHFVIIIFDIEAKIWMYLDPKDKPITKSLLRFVTAYMDELKIYKEWKPKHTIQRDGWTCGLHVCIEILFPLNSNYLSLPTNMLWDRT